MGQVLLHNAQSQSCPCNTRFLRIWRPEEFLSNFLERILRDADAFILYFHLDKLIPRLDFNPYFPPSLEYLIALLIKLVKMIANPSSEA